VASSTMSRGATVTSRSANSRRPTAVVAAVQRGPSGRTATSTRSFATSMPTTAPTLADSATGQHPFRRRPPTHRPCRCGLLAPEGTIQRFGLEAIGRAMRSPCSATGSKHRGANGLTHRLTTTDGEHTRWRTYKARRTQRPLPTKTLENCHLTESSRSKWVQRSRTTHPSAFSAPLRCKQSGFQFLFLRSREEHVVQDQPVARRMGMEREIGRWVADLMLRVFRIVTAEEGPGSLPPLAMNVLDPRCPR